MQEREEIGALPRPTKRDQKTPRKQPNSRHHQTPAAVFVSWQDMADARETNKKTPSCYSTNTDHHSSATPNQRSRKNTEKNETKHERRSRYLEAKRQRLETKKKSNQAKESVTKRVDIWEVERLETKRNSRTGSKVRKVIIANLEVVQRGVVVRRQVHRARAGVVEVREGDAVLGADLVSDDDLVDVVELVPVLLVPAQTNKQCVLNTKPFFMSLAAAVEAGPRHFFQRCCCSSSRTSLTSASTTRLRLDVGVQETKRTRGSTTCNSPASL